MAQLARCVPTWLPGVVVAKYEFAAETCAFRGMVRRLRKGCA